MSKKRRRGLRWEPMDGWPLDHLLVGVATLRTIRELLIQDFESKEGTPRAWDLALWNGVTPRGSANSLERLHRLGYVHELPPERPWRAVRYRLARGHPLVAPLRQLFDAERLMCPRRFR